MAWVAEHLNERAWVQALVSSKRKKNENKDNITVLEGNKFGDRLQTLTMSE
jgi:hypothetical protein